MHEVRFARRDDLDESVFEVGDVRPELVLQNAHDGTRAYRIDAGLYRLVCRNGLVVADAQFAHVAIRHFDVSAEKFAAAAQSVAESAPRVLDAVARWQSVQLTPLDRHNFAQRATLLRWNAEQPVARLLGAGELLKPLRYGDDKSDLWTTYMYLSGVFAAIGIIAAGISMMTGRHSIAKWALAGAMVSGLAFAIVRSIWTNAGLTAPEVGAFAP